MQHIHLRFMDTEAYKQMGHLLQIGHAWGDYNCLADAASRLQISRLRKLATQLGVTPVQWPIPNYVHDFLVGVYDFGRTLYDTHGATSGGYKPPEAEVDNCTFRQLPTFAAKALLNPQHRGRGTRRYSTQRGCMTKGVHPKGVPDQRGYQGQRGCFCGEGCRVG